MGGRSVCWNARLKLKMTEEGGLWNEWKEEREEIFESIEHTRREGGKSVVVERMKGMRV